MFAAPQTIAIDCEQQKGEDRQAREQVGHQQRGKKGQRCQHRHCGDAARHDRRRRPDAALVVLSNYATDEMRTRCVAAGADHVFDKSRDIDVLVAFCISLAHRGAAH